ncbi:MAG: hypothetical protein IJS44_04275, partial [Clostridia bacterium]|nr:hypothetical protein [Clostridia bacterium]
MKKQIFSLALALCMLCSVVPFALSANADAATEIGTKAELLALMNDSTAWGGSYILTADVDLEGDAAQTPIGTSQTNFTGSFNGNRHTVSGLSLGDSQGQNLGLFGVINGALIENLTVEGTIETTVGIRVGGIAAIAKDAVPSQIKNCTSRVNIHTTASGIAGIGGILGRLDCTDTSAKVKAHWEISGCKNEGTVSCSSTYTGGIVGLVSAINKSGDFAQVDIFNNWNAGNVTAAQRPAGIASFVRPGGTRLFLIHDNLNTGTIQCSGGTAAGIVAAGNTSITSAQKAYKIYNNFNAGSVLSTQATPTLIHPLISAVTSACTAADMTNNFYSSNDTYTADATTAYETAVSLDTVKTDAAALGKTWVLTNGRTPELAVFHQHAKAYADHGDGTHSITCYCGHVEYEAHVYANGACTLCGAKEPACEHAHTHDVITLAATCSKTGLKNIVCDDCGNTVEIGVTVALDPSNHDGDLALGFNKNGA